MFDIFKKSFPFFGSVFFRGSMSPRCEEFSYLSDSGFQVGELKAPDNAHWALALQHPKWGKATLCAFKNAPSPQPFIEQDIRLTKMDKQAAVGAESSVSLKIDQGKGNMLRDRKSALYMVQSIMGKDGIVAIDHTAQSAWSRDALDEELAHDADLDVTAIYTVHAVQSESSSDSDQEEPRAAWLHSHGLSEIGCFDFDIIEPSDSLFSNASDGLRAIAFAIVEGMVAPNTPKFVLAYPGGTVGFVKASAFDSSPYPEYHRMRTEVGDDHIDGRSILCDPTRRFVPSFMQKPRPSTFLSAEIPDGIVYRFSTAASDLMAERAKNTYSLFRELMSEFADIQFPALVKLGYRVDGGEADDKEHLWFEVHKCSNGTIDATLLNEPHDIARMNAGDRAEHPAELLSDWTIMTPMGTMTPRSILPARIIRANPDLRKKLIQMLKQMNDE